MARTFCRLQFELKILANMPPDADEFTVNCHCVSLCILCSECIYLCFSYRKEPFEREETRQFYIEKAALKKAKLEEERHAKLK